MTEITDHNHFLPSPNKPDRKVDKKRYVNGKPSMKFPKSDGREKVLKIPPE